jgi:hypothetical protein
MNQALYAHMNNKRKRKKKAFIFNKKAVIAFTMLIIKTDR